MSGSDPASGKTLAVALRYDAPDAPRVVAIGHGAIGDKIVETARRHGVPLEANGPLAQALSTVKLDSEIPEELYEAMAVVIAFVMRAAAKAYTPAPRHG
jgi:flagellar biosynthesis protein